MKNIFSTDESVEINWLNSEKYFSLMNQWKGKSLIQSVKIWLIHIFQFSKKNKSNALKIYTYAQKSIENKKGKFLENVKKIKNIEFKGGRSS